MTAPKINTISRAGARFYVHPETGAKAPGVTSIVDMLPKPFLRFWASKAVAKFAIDNLGELVGLALRGSTEAAIDMLKRAPERETKAAADIGSEAHDLFERMALGEKITRVHPDLKPFVEHFQAFLDAFQPEFLFTEETVWNGTVDYGGSFDALARIGGELVWLDWKTTRSGVHEQVALQLAAYRHAEYILRPDGSRVPLPQANAGAVLHVRPEGWKLVPVDCGPEQFEVFKHLREVFRWEKETKGTVLRAPVAVPASSGRRAA